MYYVISKEYDTGRQRKLNIKVNVQLTVLQIKRSILAKYLVDFGFVCCVDSLNLINIYIISLTQCISFQQASELHSSIDRILQTTSVPSVDRSFILEWVNCLFQDSDA